MAEHLSKGKRKRDPNTSYGEKARSSKRKKPTSFTSRRKMRFEIKFEPNLMLSSVQGSLKH
nr:unnamed protein product [Callosobruchus analis]